MNRALTLTAAAALLWALGAVWVYDCRIKRVCGPDQPDVPDAVEADTVQAPAEPAAAAAAAPVSTPSATISPAPRVATPPTGVVLTVAFDARSAALLPPPDAAARLETLRRGIALGQKIRVLGHSDGRGARARIAIVSLQRAEALRDWLLSQGIPASAIAAVESREDREPIASNHREDGRRQNRRAEAVLISKDP